MEDRERYLMISGPPGGRSLKLGLLFATQIANQDKDERGAILIVPKLDHLKAIPDNHYSEVFGMEGVKELRRNRQLKSERFTLLRLESPATLKSVDVGGIVVAAFLSQPEILNLEKKIGIPALIVIPYSIDELTEWIAEYKPRHIPVPEEYLE